VPGTPLHLPLENGSTLGQILERVGIDPDEVSNVFVNGCLLPRSVYPITLGYALAVDGPLSPEGYLNAPIRPGDRLGIFPRIMASVVV
jgi:sulfur carrier protein ThiS